jgi:uncharacterized membrane-anchored protein YitT (DUF2179 family)
MKSERKPSKKYPFKKHLYFLSIIVLATFIDCSGYLVFIKPNDILAGGLWGIAAIINYFADVIPMGVYVAALNIPLLLWGWNRLSLRFALYTVFAILLQSIMLVFLMPYLPTYVENPLLACVFGGVLCGIGAGLVVKMHGSGGGTDIIGIILHDKYDMSVSSVSLVVKVFVVSVGAFIFGFEPAMYTIVYMFITAIVFTQVLEGFNRKRNMMIITDKGYDIADRMLREIGRGVTIMSGEGGYSHQKRDVLFCVVSRFDLMPIKDMVREIDPHAFVCINQTHEVMGSFPKRPRPLGTDFERALPADEMPPVSKAALPEKEEKSV